MRLPFGPIDKLNSAGIGGIMISRVRAALFVSTCVVKSSMLAKAIVCISASRGPSEAIDRQDKVSENAKSRDLLSTHQIIRSFGLPNRRWKGSIHTFKLEESDRKY